MQMGKTMRKINFFLIFLAFLLVGVLLLTNRGVLGDTFHLLKSLNPLELLALPILLLGSHISIAAAYRSFLRSVGSRVKFNRMLPMVWALNFVNQILPSGGVSGLSYLVYGMRGRAKAGQLTIAHLARYILSYLSYMIVLTIALGFLIIGNDVTSANIRALAILLGMLMIGALIFFYILIDRKRVRKFIGFIDRLIESFFRRFSRGGPEVVEKAVNKLKSTVEEFHKSYKKISKHKSGLYLPAFFMIMSTFFEVAVVYASFLILGVTINPGIVIIAFAIANSVGVLSIVPGDVGVHEATMIAALSAAGVDAATAISATLLYRVFNKMLYLPIGFAAYTKLLKPASQKINA